MKYCTITNVARSHVIVIAHPRKRGIGEVGDSEEHDEVVCRGAQRMEEDSVTVT